MVSNKNIKKWRFLPELVIFITAVIFFLSQFYFFNLGTNTVGSLSTKANLVNLQTVADFKKLEICGTWPVTDVALSSGRGNPFNKKNEVVSSVVASDKTCIPSN